MSGLLWWSGITWDTSMRDIGWTWVVLVVLIVMLIRTVIETWRVCRRPRRAAGGPT